MKTAIAAAAVSCMIGAAGFGGALALAGGQRAAWPCSERPWEKHCKPSTGTSTVTVPGTTVTVTVPGTSPPTPAQTVTVVTPAPPAQTVTVTTPAPPAKTVTKIKTKPTCAHGDWDITAPRCKPKLIVACKGKYRKEILRWCLRYEAAKRKKAQHGNQPRDIFHTEGGVTG